MECARKLGDKLGVNWDKIPIAEFKKGMKVEMEHKDITKGDPKMTAKIALAHLKESPDYYSNLEVMEDKMKHEKRVMELAEAFGGKIKRKKKKIYDIEEELENEEPEEEKKESKRGMFARLIKKQRKS